MMIASSEIWARLCAELADVYEIKDHGYDLLVVSLPDEPKPFKVGIRRRSPVPPSTGGDVVEVTAHIRDSRRVQYGVALRVSSELTAGSLCMLGPELFVRKVLDLGALDLHRLRQVIETLARLGRTLGPQLTTSLDPDDEAQAFAHLVD